VIEFPSSLIGKPVIALTGGFLDRLFPFRTDNEILKHVLPVRRHARKTARSPFVGDQLVGASARLERAGMPAGYHLSAIAREYSAFEDCEQLVASLASRVGNPQIAPVPPLWPLLAQVLLEFRSVISPHAVLRHAAKDGLSEEAQRGLIIVTYLFPELKDWLAGVKLGIPRWERMLAVPLAARKLVLLEKHY